MNRLQLALRRLYHMPDSHDDVRDDAPSASGLIAADGRVRAVVMAIAKSAGWETTTMLWAKVQSDLDLPSPAMAISGIDSYQIWFSLAEPVPVAQARHFLDLLRLRYLSAIPPDWIRMKPAEDIAAPGHPPRMVPSLQPETGYWSAFVIPSLGGMFENEPWLESEPGSDSQADLLLRLESIKPDEFQQALERLTAAVEVLNAAQAPMSSNMESGAASLVKAALDLSGEGSDPKQFLLAVMNDPTIALHLRIEAAKALLPYGS